MPRKWSLLGEDLGHRAINITHRFVCGAPKRPGDGAVRGALVSSSPPILVDMQSMKNADLICAWWSLVNITTSVTGGNHESLLDIRFIWWSKPQINYRYLSFTPAIFCLLSVAASVCQLRTLAVLRYSNKD